MSASSTISIASSYRLSRAISVVETTKLRKSLEHNLPIRRTSNKECNLVFLFDLEAQELATSTIRAMRDCVQIDEFEDLTNACTTFRSKECVT